MRLLSAWRLAERIGADLVCHWPEETVQRTEFRFRELFDGQPPFALSNDYPDFRGVATLNEALTGGRVDMGRLAPEFVYTTTGLTLLPGEELAIAQAEARHLFSRLVIAQPIQDAVQELDAAVPLKEAMAVHVRRGSDIIPRLLAGDLPPSVEEGHVRGYARMFVDLESYRDAIKNLGSPKCFVFCADDADRAALKKDVGGYSVDDFEVIKRLTPLQRDLAEILIMSRNRFLLGPKSNYSGLARLLGNYQLKWIAHWVRAEDMVAMISQDFPSRPDLQTRVLKAAAEWYERISPAVGARFAAAATEIETRFVPAVPASR